MSVFMYGLNELMVEFASEAAEAPARARMVVQATARQVKATMQSFAPRDTGELAASISYETKMLKDGAVGEIGPTATRNGFPYPAAVEWGTSRMAPQAFAGPALDRHSGEFVEQIADKAIGW